MTESRPAFHAGRKVVQRGYVLTRAGNAAAIRAELDDVTLDLVALDQGTKSWDAVCPDLTNGDLHQQAINATYERMLELQRQLRDAEAGS